MNESDALPLEDFIQALTSQLDRAQAALALKAGNMPLTFAVKDLTFDLRTQVEMRNSAVHIRPAAANEADASTIHFTLTTITAPMIQENTPPADPDEPPLQEVLGADLTEDEQRRLEWAGIRSVRDLRRAQMTGGEQSIRRITQLPVHRLQQALNRAARPRIARIMPEPRSLPESPEPLRPLRPEMPARPLRPEGASRVRRTTEPPMTHPPLPEPRIEPPRKQALLRIRGDNLLSDREPVVRIDNRTVPVLRADERELLIAPMSDQLSGTLSIEVEPGNVVETQFDVSDFITTDDRQETAQVESIQVNSAGAEQDARLDSNESAPSTGYGQPADLPEGGESP